MRLIIFSLSYVVVFTLFSCGNQPSVQKQRITEDVSFVKDDYKDSRQEYFEINGKKYSQVTEYYSNGKIKNRTCVKNDVVGTKEIFYYSSYTEEPFKELDSIIVIGYYKIKPNSIEQSNIGRLVFKDDGTIDNVLSSYYTISPDEYFTTSRSLILKTHWKGPSEVIFGKLKSETNFMIDNTMPSDTLTIPKQGLSLFLEEDKGNAPFFVFEGHILLLTPTDTISDSIRYERIRIPFIHCVARTDP